MQKKYFSSLVFMLLSFGTMAQIPPWPVTLLNSTGSNAFPFNTPSNKKTQFLYRPGDFGSSVSGGLIDTLWFRNSNTSTALGPGTYENLDIRMGQFTSLVFPGAGSLDFYAPSQLTTVLSAASYTINQTTSPGGWYYIPLTTPFPFDPTMTLVVDVEMTNRTSTTGFQSATFTVAGAPNHQRLTSTMNGAVSGNASAILSDLGLSLAPLLGLDGAIQGITSPAAPLSPGTPTLISMVLQNRGTNPMVTATVGYQIDNNPPVTEAWSGSLASFATATHTFLNPINIPTAQSFVLKVWVTNPNGLGPDLNSQNDTMVRTFCLALPAGTYTIGGSGASFNTIQEAVDAMVCGGVGGPVTFNINPGTYYGTYSIPDLPGVSPTHTINFNGITGLPGDVILIHDTASGTTVNRSHFVLAHTARVSFQGLTFRKTNPTSATGQAALVYGGPLTGGDVVNCVFEDQTQASSANNVGILHRGSFGTFLNNSFDGFYYGIFMDGPSANPFMTNNQVLNNQFQNYLYRAIYALNQNSPIISGNTIENFIGSSTAGAGVWTANTYAAEVTNNSISGDMSASGFIITNPNGDTADIRFNTNKFFNNVINGRLANSLSGTTITLQLFSLSGSFSTTTVVPNPRDAVEILNNTAYYEYNSTSASTLQGAFTVSGGTVTTPVWGYIHLVNNHFEVNPLSGNLPSAFRLVRYSNESQVDSLVASHNNYRIGGGTPPAMFRITTPSNDYVSLAAWQSAVNRDSLSVSIDPVFISPLLLQPTSVALDNLGVPISFVSLDIQGTPRSSITPDIGAYEFVGLVFSQITFTPLADTLVSAGRMVTALISDSVSSIVSGSARLFYKKTTQAVWQVDSVPVVSGNAYTFYIDYASIGGVSGLDSIEYYLAVLNALGTVTTSPLGGQGLHLGSVIPPLLPHMYRILPQISGTYRVGTSAPADFPTITAAAAFMNAGLLVGATNFLLIDSVYGSAENFPIVIGPFTGSTPSSHVKIQLDSSRSSAHIVGMSLPAALVLNGVSHFTLDGLNLTGQRGIIIENQSVADNTAGIFIRSTVNEAIDSVVLRGLEVMSGINTGSNTFGIHIGGSAISISGTGVNMKNVYVLQNAVKRAGVGIYLRGITSDPATNARIAGNLIGDTAAAMAVNVKGIDIQNAVNTRVENNEIFNITGTNSITRSGIELGGTGSSNLVTNANHIYDVFTPATNGANGIYVISGNNHIITNNVIHGIRTQNGSNLSQLSNAFGIRLGSGTGHQVYYNSVHMHGDYTNTSTAGAASAALVISSTVVTGVDIRNNVFSNIMTSNSSGANFFNAIWLPTGYAATNLTINNNAYHVDTTNADYAVGRVGTTATPVLHPDVASWRAYTSAGLATNDLFSVPPVGRRRAPFVSNTNLTIPAGTATGIESGGVVILSLDTPNRDFNNIVRPAGSGLAPDMGAYEFNGVVLPDQFPPTIDSFNISPNTAQCTVTPRSITVHARDNIGGVGIDSVMVEYTIAGTMQPRILLTRTAGTALAGTWTGTVPAASAPLQEVVVNVLARDSLGNFAPRAFVNRYTDDYFVINAGNDTIIQAGDTATLVATSVGFSASSSLTATRIGGNGQSGVTFNIRALSPVLIDSIMVQMYGTIGSTGNMDIWYINTAINGQPNISAASGWVQVTSGFPGLIQNTGTTANGILTSIPLSTPVAIPAGSTFGFYIGGSSIAYTTHSTANQDTFTDGNIVLSNGINIGYGGLAPNPGFHPRQFNGAVSYKASGGIIWTALGSSIPLHSGDTFSVAPSTTTTYVATITDSICFKSDTVTVTVTANNINDVGVSQILLPTAPQLNAPNQVKVVIENFGNQPATGFDVGFALLGATTDISTNAISRTVLPGDTIHHIFTLEWTPTVGGTRDFCAYTKGLAGDNNLANDTTCVVYQAVGVREVSNLLSRVYPNPADQYVKFELVGSQGVGALEIRDQLGRVVWREQVDLSTGNVHEVKTETYAAGVYNYRFILRDQVQYGQVVIRR